MMHPIAKSTLLVLGLAVLPEASPVFEPPAAMAARGVVRRGGVVRRPVIVRAPAARVRVVRVAPRRAGPLSRFLGRIFGR